MRKLFRSFDRFGVESLLISGQASVLYGAATFSEDIDVWVRPGRVNVFRFLRALARCRARVYKLTPPLTPTFLAAGHGFHFTIPDRPAPVYLDMMSHPPRVGSFSRARQDALRMRTPWGEIPVVSVRDLVELKKTRRLSDYEVISSLVVIALSGREKPTRSDLQWAARNSFRVEDRLRFLQDLGRPSRLSRCRDAIAQEVSRHQRRDTNYWMKRLRDLRRLHRQGSLLREGTPVSQLI